MKNFILLVLFLMTVACTPSESPKKVETPNQQEEVRIKQPAVVTIDIADRTCVADSDCTSVSTKCSCSCGEGVSKHKVQKYLDLVEASCQNYTGPVCKMLCNGTVKCLEKVCIYVY